MLRHTCNAFEASISETSTEVVIECKKVEDITTSHYKSDTECDSIELDGCDVLESDKNTVMTSNKNKRGRESGDGKKQAKKRKRYKDPIVRVRRPFEQQSKI